MMHRLTRANYQKAVDYLAEHARPLEQARFAYHFQEGSANAVLVELTLKQNADGGFGHGLEPDIRLADSSVIATTLAFQHFRELGTAADHPAVVAACRYLNDTYDATRHNWYIVPPNVDDAPHAPWWQFSEDPNPINPRAEIAGYLHEYAAHFPEAMRRKVTDAVIAHLLAQPDEMEMHDLQCYIRLSETEALPQAERTRIVDKLKRVVANTVERDPAKWREYGLPPLAVVSTPDSPFADMLKDTIPPNLDFLIDTQGDHGGWMPTWSWGDDAGDAWEQARREWSGFLTLANLRTLRTFERID